MPTDKEQRDLLQWQAKQEQQREEKHSVTTTDRINRSLSEAEQRILQQMAEVWQKVNEHDDAFAELGKAASAGFGRITSTFGKLTGKRT